MADILAKQARGEPLTNQEAGYKGACFRKQRGRVAPAKPAAAPAAPSAAPAGNPLFEDAAAVATPANRVAAVPVDSGLIHRAADSILSSLDKITQGLVGSQIAKAGADAATVERFKDAVAMKDAKAMMVEGSDPVVLWLCEKFNCGPDQIESKVKGGGFIGGMALWLIGVQSGLKAAKELQAEKLKRDPPTA